MISEIFCALHTAIMATGMFANGYDYVKGRQVNSTDGSRVVKPMYNNSAGDIDVFDRSSGAFFYLRKTGSISSSPGPVYNVSCDSGTYVNITMPLRCVAVVPREKMGDARYADELLYEILIKAIQGGMTAGSIGVTNQVTSSSTEGYSIWPEEVQGVDFLEKNFISSSFIAIDFAVKWTVNTACIETCENSGADADDVIYYGNYDGTTLSEADILTLTQASGSIFDQSFDYPSGAGRKHIYYPSSQGTPLSFDNLSSPFDVIMDVPYSVTVNGIAYTGYYSLNNLNGTLTMQPLP